MENYKQILENISSLFILIYNIKTLKRFNNSKYIFEFKEVMLCQ